MSISLLVHPQELKSSGCRNFYLLNNGIRSCMVHTEKENLQEGFGQWDLKAGEFGAKVSLSPLYAEPQRKPMIRNWETLQNAWIVQGALLSHLPSVPRPPLHYCALPWWKAWCCSILLDVQLARLCPPYPPKYWFQMSLVLIV